MKKEKNNNTNSNTKISLQIGKALNAKLGKWAKAEEVSKSAVARRLIKRGFAEEEKGALQ